MKKFAETGIQVNMGAGSCCGCGSDMNLKVGRPSVLLHSCCGPCSTAVIERLLEDYNITVFFYNPNITEAEEYALRLDAQKTVIEKFNGGPVGLDTLAAAIGEDSGTIEDVYEPYLVKNGFINRTPKGRVATDFAYHHFGIAKP